jgi:glycosyltransferase involved in cell wall biosynthesis
VQQRLKIGVVAPAWFAVPPERYGGIEWVVALLADGLVDEGHEVVLFASGGSVSKAELVSTFAEPPSYRIGQSIPELEHTLTAWHHAHDFDLVNDHSGLLAASLAALCPVPVCHTIHGPLDGEMGRVYRQVAELNPRLRYISLSMNQRRPAPELPWLYNCPNALDLDAYPFSARRGDYLLFLGRLSPDKGAARAIQVARESGSPLKIAGKMHDQVEREYFQREIAPYLGHDIEYLGEVSHEDKVRLLQRARCTLFPIAWEEPFGLVMIESMACGTPVVATRWGAVPEVIGDGGEGGIVVDDLEAMVGAVAAADEIDPAACRAYVEERFSERRMVRNYLEAFRLLLEEQGPAASPRRVG